MDKIEQIHISRVQYSIEIKAQALLTEYLKDIRSNLDVDTADEVIGDIESRIPELLAERKVYRGDVITKSDIEEIRKQLGEPEQFSEGKPTERTAPTTKKLFRDPDGALVAGVASGIGKYLNIDANLVRLVFFATIFFGGFGVVMYLFLWFLLPEAKSSADKLMMSGMPVTIASLQKYQSSVGQRLKNGPRLIQHILIMICKIICLTILAVIASALLIALGLFTGFIFVEPFRSIVSSFDVDYALIGLLWLVCLAFIGLISMLILGIQGHRTAKIKASSIFIAVTLVAALAGLGATGVMAFNHFSNEYGNGKATAVLAVDGSSASAAPTQLQIKSNQYLSVKYVISSGPVHASYVAFPGLSKPDLHITNSNGVITVDSGALDQAAPNCLGGLCRQIYLPIRMTLYGPAVTQITDSNGATLSIDDATLASTLSVTATNDSTINLNNSTGTTMSIDATDRSTISAFNSSVSSATVTVDSTSLVNAPATNTLAATVPVNCDQNGDQLLSLDGFPSQTTINGQLQSMSALENNSCLDTNSGPAVPPPPPAKP